jgi:hypothetical protein
MPSEPKKLELSEGELEKVSGGTGDPDRPIVVGVPPNPCVVATPPPKIGLPPGPCKIGR